MVYVHVCKISAAEIDERCMFSLVSCRDIPQARMWSASVTDTGGCCRRIRQGHKLPLYLRRCPPFGERWIIGRNGVKPEALTLQAVHTAHPQWTAVSWIESDNHLPAMPSLSNMGLVVLILGAMNTAYVNWILQGVQLYIVSKFLLAYQESSASRVFFPINTHWCINWIPYIPLVFVVVILQVTWLPKLCSVILVMHASPFAISSPLSKILQIPLVLFRSPPRWDVVLQWGFNMYAQLSSPSDITFQYFSNEILLIFRRDVIHEARITADCEKLPMSVRPTHNWLFISICRRT